jgi:3-phenylpropionate/trans-cinnamate dioxygenase ferredoxin reductase subunit
MVDRTVERVVIVGAGVAGHRTAAALRKKGFDGLLTMVGDEAHKPYDPPPPSKQILQGVIEEDVSFFACDGLDITWKLADPAAAEPPSSWESSPPVLAPESA